MLIWILCISHLWDKCLYMIVLKNCQDMEKTDSEMAVCAPTWPHINSSTKVAADSLRVKNMAQKYFNIKVRRNDLLSIFYFWNVFYWPEYVSLSYSLFPWALLNVVERRAILPIMHLGTAVILPTVESQNDCENTSQCFGQTKTTIPVMNVAQVGFWNSLPDIFRSIFTKKIFFQSIQNSIWWQLYN